MNRCFSKSYSREKELYSEKMFPMAMGKVIAKGTAPVTMARLRFETREQRDRFLEDSQFLLEERITCFAEGEEDLVVLFVCYRGLGERHAWEILKQCGGSVVKAAHCQRGGEALWGAYKRFNQQEDAPISWKGIFLNKRLP